MAIVRRYLRNPRFSRLSRTPTCDGRTDGQTLWRVKTSVWNGDVGVYNSVQRDNDQLARRLLAGVDVAVRAYLRQSNSNHRRWSLPPLQCSGGVISAAFEQRRRGGSSVAVSIAVGHGGAARRAMHVVPRRPRPVHLLARDSISFTSRRQIRPPSPSTRFECCCCCCSRRDEADNRWRRGVDRTGSRQDVDLHGYEVISSAFQLRRVIKTNRQRCRAAVKT